MFLCAFVLCCHPLRMGIMPPSQPFHTPVSFIANFNGKTGSGCSQGMDGPGLDECRQRAITIMSVAGLAGLPQVLDQGLKSEMRWNA